MLFFRYPSYSFGQASREEVRNALKKEGLDDDDLFLTDSSYRLPKKSDVLSLFSKNFGRFVKYRKDVYDCEDFSRAASATLHLLYGNVAVGDIAVRRSDGNHMLNVVVTSGLEVVYVEPQGNKIVENQKPYFAIV